MPNLHSRPDKLDHAQTVLYEIDMLRFARNRLSENKFQSDGEEWIYLEAFLLHFRNLIEFFKGKTSRDTLSISEPADFWSKNIPDTSELVRPGSLDKIRGSRQGRQNLKIPAALH